MGHLIMMRHVNFLLDLRLKTVRALLSLAELSFSEVSMKGEQKLCRRNKKGVKLQLEI